MSAESPIPPAADFSDVGVVVIGRNEGERLARCLMSIGGVAKRVYVDSGSTDGSVELARGLGADVVELAIPPAFTAARARNDGLARLCDTHPDLQFVQMVDGDCEMQPGWLSRARATLVAEPGLALVFGIVRERHPERSIYNALCDDEWKVPAGDSAVCGGIALLRIEALQQVGLYDVNMIAGEDTELAMRLRKRGWRLVSLDAEMALHDADIRSFGQWWKRTRRSGHAYGEMAFLHPDAQDPNWPRTVKSIVAWGFVLPMLLVAALVLALTTTPLWWIAVAPLSLVWPLKMASLARRQRQRGLGPKVAIASGVLLMLGKLPQVLGLFTFYRNKVFGRRTVLIEHKRPRAA